MTFAKLPPFAAALAMTLAITPFAANAQDAGVTVYSQIDDSTVGTIESNDGSTVLLDTGAYKAPLPLEYLALREGKWTINATKPQIDDMMASAAAEAEAKLAAVLVDGSAVMTADGMPAGTILAMDAAMDHYLIENDTGVVTLKREHFAVDANGALTALFTGEQLATFTIAVPQGAVVETPEGKMTRTADGWEAMEDEAAETAASDADASMAGASE